LYPHREALLTYTAEAATYIRSVVITCDERNVIRSAEIAGCTLAVARDAYTYFLELTRLAVHNAAM